jgi:hypothetical protein
MTGEIDGKKKKKKPKESKNHQCIKGVKRAHLLRISPNIETQSLLPFVAVYTQASIVSEIAIATPQLPPLAAVAHASDEIFSGQSHIPLQISFSNRELVS